MLGGCGRTVPGPALQSKRPEIGCNPSCRAFLSQSCLKWSAGKWQTQGDAQQVFPSRMLLKRCWTEQARKPDQRSTPADGR